MSAGRADAVFVQPTLIDQTVIELAARHRLPSFSFVRGYVTAGGLLSYSANLDEMTRSSADYIDRILRGADPGRLPIVQSSSFDLLINRRTAHALGLAVPRALMLRASEVIG
jgi:putative ABC transport system substrate-binding protein